MVLYQNWSSWLIDQIAQISYSYCEHHTWELSQLLLTTITFYNSPLCLYYLTFFLLLQ